MLLSTLAFAIIGAIVSAISVDATTYTYGIAGGYSYSYFPVGSDVCSSSYPFTMTGSTSAVHCTTYSCSNNIGTCIMPSWPSPENSVKIVMIYDIFGDTIYYDVINYVYPSVTSITPTSIPAIDGGPVTITGTNFGNNRAYYTYLELGSVVVDQAQWLSYSDTEIVFTMPTGQTSNLQIVGGLAWGSSGAYTHWPSSPSINYAPFPSISSVSPLNLPTGIGSYLTINGAAFGLIVPSKIGYIALANSYYSTVLSDSWAVGFSGTEIVAHFPTHSATLTDTPHRFTVYVAWGSGAYTQLNNQVAFQ